MTRAALPRSRSALLLIDVINLFDFPAGPKYARQWLPSARRIRTLRDRAHRAGVPVIHVNDNFGRWRSDFKSLISMCSTPGRAGAPIADLLTPTDRDFFILKPHLSGFHETPLHMLLQSGGVRTVVLTGFAADACILFTAGDAHMLGYQIVVPTDCVASEKDAERAHALARMRKFLDAKTRGSAGLRFRK